MTKGREKKSCSLWLDLFPLKMFVMKFEAGFEKQQQQQKTADKSFCFLLKKKEEKIDVISSASLSVICMELEIHRGQMFVDVKKIPNMMFIILILQQRSKWNAKKRRKKKALHRFSISPRASREAIVHLEKDKADRDGWVSIKLAMWTDGFD